MPVVRHRLLDRDFEARRLTRREDVAGRNALGAPLLAHRAFEGGQNRPVHRSRGAVLLREIKDAKPLAELDEDWAEGLVSGRAFVQIVYQSETGDFEIPPLEERRMAP